MSLQSGQPAGVRSVAAREVEEDERLQRHLPHLALGPLRDDKLVPIRSSAKRTGGLERDKRRVGADDPSAGSPRAQDEPDVQTLPPSAVRQSQLHRGVGPEQGASALRKRRLQIPLGHEIRRGHGGVLGLPAAVQGAGGERRQRILPAVQNGPRQDRGLRYGQLLLHKV